MNPALELLHPALCSVLNERQAQDERWGEQNHDAITWSAILAEECGEFAQEALTVRFGNVGANTEALRNEAVQCAAVALAIVECIDRNTVKEAANG